MMEVMDKKLTKSTQQTRQVSDSYTQRNRRRATLAYSLAVIATLVTLFLRLSMASWMGDRMVLILFLIPISLSAYAGGLGPGLVSTLISTVLGLYFLVPRTDDYAFQRPSDLLQLFLLIIVGTLISALNGRLHRSKHRIESDSRQHAVTLASIGDAVITTDALGTVSYINREAERLTGWKNEEAVGKPLSSVFQIVHVVSRQPIDNPAEVVLHKGTVLGLASEALLISKDGREFPIDDSAAPIREVDGEIQGVVLVFRDSSEKRKAEEALQASQSRYRDLVEMAPDAIFVNRRNKITLVNGAALELFGARKAEDLLGKSPFDLFHPDDHEKIRNRIADLEIRLPTPRLEETIVRLDGTIRNVEVASAPFMDQEGLAIQVILRDVTDRNQAELRIRENEVRLAGIINSAMDGILIVDEHQRITLFNPAAEKIFGCAKEEVIGQPLGKLIPAGLRSAHEQHFQSFAHSGVTRRTIHDLGSLTGQRADGTLFPLEVSISRIDVSGRSLFTAIFRDISARARAEAALQESENRFRRLANSLPQLVWTSEPDGQCDYFNQQWIDYTGIPMNEQLGIHWLQQIHPDDRAELTQLWNTAVTTGTDFRAEFRIRRNDGAYRWFDTRALPMHDAHGTLVHWFGSCTDIHEQREMRETLRESEQALKHAQIIASIGSWTADLQAGTINTSLEAAQVLGWPAGIHNSEKLFSHVHPDDLARVTESWDAAKRGAPYDIEHRIVTNDQIRWLHTKAEIEFSNDRTRIKATGISQDITDRKKAEQALFEREEQLRLFVDYAPAAIAMLDKHMRYVAVSQRWLSDYGLGVQDIIGRNHYEIFPDVPTRWKEIHQRCLAGAVESCDEDPFPRSDGKIDWIRWEIHPWKSTDSEIAGIIIFSENITERKKAEEALRESEERFRLFMQHFPGLAYIKDLSSVVLFANHGFEKYLGLPPAEMVGKTNEQLFPAEFATTIAADDKRVLSTGESMEVEERFADRMWSTHKFVIPQQGQAPLLAGFTIDITERRHAEEALRESEERFRTTLYSIGDGVMTTDLDGRVLQMNPVAETLTGWTEAEARGQRIQYVFRIVNEDSGTTVDNPVQKVLESGTVVELANHTILLSRDGTRRPIADSGAPIRNSHGEIIGVVLVFNDQSERHNLQAQLIQAQKMEAVGRLAGGVAHDYNNMIGVILGYATILKQSLNPLDPLYHHTEAILSAAERSANLTRQLLAFARKQIITPAVLNLNSSLLSLEKMLTRLIGEDIELKLSLSPDLWNVKIDPTQVDQILANFATNARDAIADVGAITIETNNVAKDQVYSKEQIGFVPGDYVSLTFSDNGRGMDKATQERIFEPFFTTKPKDRGTGLGLATVFGIVQQNGGFINVYSEPGQGTTFKIYLPRFRGTIEQPAEQKGDIQLSGSETILVVEDELDLLEFTKGALTKHGYTVLTANSPGDAILICEMFEGAIHLVLTDVVMPGMNGKELKGRLESLKPEMKVMFMSGYTADIVANRGILDEGVNFLQKPFTPLDLARKVRHVLNT